MAIYHLEAKIVSRGAGRSAVAAAAYLSCSKILNDYDGIQHDYTRKKGLAWQEVFLPEFAPSEWKERSVLWNAVEENEKTKDSRLAREFVVALPIELNETQWEKLLSDFISGTFVDDGMCADVAIHDPYPPGHNPHAHIMLTVRPLDEKGNWKYKTQKEYLCVKNGEEQGFTADEFKTAQTEGWEKQYQYKVGKKKVYMTASAAEEKGYERVSKYPKSTKYGRQNPITMTSKIAWGEVSPGEWGNYITLQEKANPVFLSACAMKWNQLQNENAPLRAMLNGKLQSVSEDIYDSFILREIAEQPEPVSYTHLTGPSVGVGTTIPVSNLEALTRV